MYRMDVSKMKKWIGYIALTILVAFLCKLVYWKVLSKPDSISDKNTEAMTVQHSGHQQRGRWGPPPYVYRSSVVGSTGGGGYNGYGYYYPFYYDIPALQTGYYVEKEKKEYDQYAITSFAIFSIVIVFAILVT
jgi:hypothetical protein